MVETENESHLRDAVEQLEQQLARARASLQVCYIQHCQQYCRCIRPDMTLVVGQKQESFNSSLKQIAETVEAKVERQESELGATVTEAEQALEGARRDLSLVTALQHFVDAVGLPLASQRSTELRRQLSE